jgi:hypothetical protein
MSRERSTDPSPIFFTYGEARPETERLALLGGALLLDSGEADQTFLLRCQDRYVAYAWMFGLRPILLVEDEGQVGSLDDAIAALRNDCAQVTAATGLGGLFQIRNPLVFCCDLIDLTIRSLGPPSELQGPAVFHLNQVSPTAAAILLGVNRELQMHGVSTAIDPARLRADSRNAMRFNDKVSTATFTHACPTPAPPQLETRIMSIASLFALEDWEALTAWFSAQPARVDGSIVIKSARDSGGNVAEVFSRETFETSKRRLLDKIALSTGQNEKAAISALRADIAASRLNAESYSDARLLLFETMRRERRAALELLVQRWVPHAAPAPDMPAACGMSFHVDETSVSLIAVNGQAYHDRERHHFRGAQLDDRIHDHFARSSLLPQMMGLCRHFASAGYRGPISFDALREGSGYVLIDDCNPRLSAIMPTIALRRALADIGLQPASLLSLGYRGETLVPDLAAALAALADAGLLYTRTTRSGILPIPNMVRSGGVDLFVVDAPLAILDRAAPVLAEAGCHARISSVIPGLSV